jgi:hypothetical protein
MGRGRAKAKQTKVARDLKYRSQGTDFDALARELHGGHDVTESDVSKVTEDEETDEYGSWADDYDEDPR